MRYASGAYPHVALTSCIFSRAGNSVLCGCRAARIAAGHACTVFTNDRWRHRSGDVALADRSPGTGDHALAACRRTQIRRGPRAAPRHPLRPPPAAWRPRSFRSLDTDGDGSLTLAEASADPVLRENVAAFDSNGDGRLSRDEFASYQPGPGDAAGD